MGNPNVAGNTMELFRLTSSLVFLTLKASIVALRLGEHIDRYVQVVDTTGRLMKDTTKRHHEDLLYEASRVLRLRGQPEAIVRPGLSRR